MIAVTGLGVVSAAGAGVAAHLAAAREDRSCLGPLEEALCAGLPVRFGGRVPDAALSPAPPGDRALRMALPALRECLANAPPALRRATGLCVGTGLGSMERTEEALSAPPADSRRLHPHAITRELAEATGLGGPLGTYTVTCASALFALDQACAEIARGRAQAMVCGGLETLSRTILGGFCALDALSRSAKPSAPAPRDGIVLGEGASFVLLEALSHAQRRGARPLALLAGRDLRCDGRHMTTPDPEGRGMALAARAALAEAGRTPTQVEAITLTADASPAYAAVYEHALSPLFGAAWRERASSWEPRLGHVLGASGALGLLHGALLVDGSLGPAPPRSVLALTVGFGGLNGAILLEGVAA